MRKKKGVVTSAKMTGTVTVTVHRHAFHPIYKKRFRKSKKFLADAKGMDDLIEGDTVVITECRPISKLKKFKVIEVLGRVPRVSDIKEEEGIEEAIHGEKREGGSGIGDQGDKEPESQVPNPKSPSQDSNSTTDNSNS
ncbi:MAG: uS17 family ribosomal protein [Candidatus Peribacteraceae bacterium]|jgi:small subunit ribosomal protein S17|nr:uS17 family ribosomal protein [Candidatus Peribacteraceae bacterium]MDP7454113.1 uS17 family ribosomal protein [Candidatus Peribacteraceae bacterium]MDP7645991.1 uS17 family ribosomal protein [Candidatus Peribacteraceae bacterium]|tara:strand:- start:1465 stop:1878 length:414 start_codon:yes stop_codon:yes gene_type:complete